MKGTGVSLWLTPQGEMRRRLCALIRALARRYGAPVFAPHVTLLAGLAGGAAEVLSRARSAVTARPFEVRLLGPEAGDSYFRCLYLRVQPSPELLALHERLREAFGRSPEPPFFPHLSLLYAPPPAPPLAGELRGSLPAGFAARRLDVYSTDGPVEAWHGLGRLRLR
jgi:2'-5' RNA ligase